jgi:hypothetical protein
MHDGSAKMTKDQLVGSWTLVAMTVGDGAETVEPFGPAPRGAMFMDASRFSIIITRAALPSLVAGTREHGTPAENRAIVQGSIAYFGTYVFDEASSMLTAHIDGSTFPNFIGQDQQRLIRIEGNELTYVNPHPSGGGGTAQVRWKRAR